MMERLGSIRETEDSKIKKRWDDWEKAQKAFVAEQTKVSLPLGESVCRPFVSAAS
jgi:hypothetical protein